LVHDTFTTPSRPSFAACSPGQGYAYFTITMAYGKSIATATNTFASNYISNTKTVSCAGQAGREGETEHQDGV
jgi:hypothetical protein